MIYPSADKIEANIESKYELVILAAKRCRQIREGSRPRVETDSENPLTIALEEIAAGVIKGREDKSSLAGQEAEADRQANEAAKHVETGSENRRGRESEERTGSDADGEAAAPSRCGAIAARAHEAQEVGAIVGPWVGANFQSRFEEPVGRQHF